MLIARDGATAGSLSGGCLEDEVIARARDVLHSEASSLLTFDTRLRFGCHGEIAIWVEPASPEFLSRLADAHAQRKAVRLATRYEAAVEGSGTRVHEDDEIASALTLVHDVLPSIQLIVIGDGPDCSALRQLTETLGWTLQQVDGASELNGCFDDRTAALVKTHNYGRDFAALRFLLPLGLRYVGLLGPRRRREQLLGDLLDVGLSIPAGLFAPAGHDLGGDSPESIALAVVAEIHAVFADRAGYHLRNLRTPIHLRDVPEEECPTDKGELLAGT
jgi:xanthine dehydrogenase accessory factor